MRLSRACWALTPQACTAARFSLLCRSGFADPGNFCLEVRSPRMKDRKTGERHAIDQNFTTAALNRLGARPKPTQEDAT